MAVVDFQTRRIHFGWIGPHFCDKEGQFRRIGQESQIERF